MTLGKEGVCERYILVALSHLPGAVAALSAQVLPVSEQSAGPSTLQRQPRVYEGGGAAVMVHKKRLEKQQRSDKMSWEN